MNNNTPFSDWTIGYSKQMHLIAFSCPSPPRNWNSLGCQCHCLWRGWQSNSVNLNAATAVSVSATAAVPAFVSVSVSLSVSVSMTCLQVYTRVCGWHINVCKSGVNVRSHHEIRCFCVGTFEKLKLFSATKANAFLLCLPHECVFVYVCECV